VTPPETVVEEKPEAPAAEPPAFELDPALVEGVVAALGEGDAGRARELARPLHPADLADLLERLSSEDRGRLVDAIRDSFDPEVLSELDETVREEVMARLGVKSVAAAIEELETDDAVHIVEDLDRAERQQVLAAIPREERAVIVEALAHPEDSAGRLMRREVVTVPDTWNVGQTIDFMRASAERDEPSLPELFYDIFVVDDRHLPAGTVPLSRLLRSKRPVPVTAIMETKMNLIPVTMDQEEVAFLFRQRDLVSAPVVDETGRLVGAITIDDVVDVIEEEAEEDIMRMGGVAGDDFYSAAIDTTRSRFSWLFVNLLTAILASLVIGLFEATIDQIVALAVLMPIVASMGGNAGTQTLTVAVRALATKELTPTNALRIVAKELVVGAINGLLFAVLTGLVAWFWFGSLPIGAIIGMAMIVNLVVAALAGSTIPLLLERLGVDPAVSSSVFLTTVTDVVGFFAFLGLAAWILL
jgi:magnesium transporter